MKILMKELNKKEMDYDLNSLFENEIRFFVDENNSLEKRNEEDDIDAKISSILAINKKYKEDVSFILLKIHKYSEDKDIVTLYKRELYKAKLKMLNDITALIDLYRM